MSKCNDTQKAYIEKYRAKLKEAIQNLTRTDNRNGAWSVSCVQHGFLDDAGCVASDKYRIPYKSGFNINEALLSFIKR